MGGCLNLVAVESSLRAVQRAYPDINQRLRNQRDALSDEVLSNLMAGYQFIDRAVSDRLDLFANGNSRYLLELNRIVLCGSDSTHIQDFARHLDATEAHFYGHGEGGIGGIVEWRAGHRRDSPWTQAAGVYMRNLTEPQLFIEGNHRCGALIMSYVLAWEGKPPFVLTVENAESYFDLSAVFKSTRRTSLSVMFRLPYFLRDFAAFLKAQADYRYLL